MPETRLNWLNTREDYIRYLFAQAFGNAVAELVAQELQLDLCLRHKYDDVIKTCWETAIKATDLLVNNGY